MTKQEIKALRRPFVRELFRKNKFFFVLTQILICLDNSFCKGKTFYSYG